MVAGGENEGVSTLSEEQIGGGDGVAEDGKALREGGKWQGTNGSGSRMHVGKSLLSWKSVVGVTVCCFEHEAHHSVFCTATCI